jgi:hypothetical protein
MPWGSRGGHGGHRQVVRVRLVARPEDSARSTPTRCGRWKNCSKKRGGTACRTGAMSSRSSRAPGHGDPPVRVWPTGASAGWRLAARTAQRPRSPAPACGSGASTTIGSGVRTLSRALQRDQPPRQCHQKPARRDLLPHPPRGVLGRTSRGWRGLTITADGLRLLQDPGQLAAPSPSQLRPRTVTGEDRSHP